MKTRLNYHHLSFAICGRKFYTGLILTALSLCACLAVGASATAGVVLCTAMLVLAMLKVECTPDLAKWLNIVWLMFAPAMALLLTQMLLNVGILYLDAQRIILGMMCAGIVLMLFLLITMNIRAAVISEMIALMLLAFINHFVYTFRGSEFSPYDVLVAGTAAAVLEQYSFTVPPVIVFACVIAALYCYAGFCIPAYLPMRNWKQAVGYVAVEFVLVVSFLFGSASLQSLHFAQMGSVYNGFLLNFTLQIKNMYVTPPDQYHIETIGQLETQYAPKQQTQYDDTQPDIIVIMSESFADMRIFNGSLDTNIEITPFWDSLRETSISGYALVSGFGGGTSKSEYEFLTGNTQAWLPSGSFPFQQYIRSGTSSIVSQLERYGYVTTGTHPENEKNYMRSSVYPTLGFDSSKFINDYPREKLLRGLVSDREMYEQIITWYEARDTGTPWFLFGVSMQNHGGYNYSGSDFSKTVKLEGYTGVYPYAEQYLTCLNHSDQALEYLIRYFETVEDDVVIAVFGDHFPQVDSGFAEELYGGPFAALEEQMLQYTVPFFVWANFDIEARDVGLTSLNFLSNYVYEAAGLPLPAYNAFLKDIQTVVPAMNAFGYYSNEKGTIIPYEEAEGKEAEALNQYRILQYNSLFDEDHRSQVFFPTMSASE